MTVSARTTIRVERRLSTKQLSLLAADVDQVWLNADDPQGDAELLRQAASLDPEHAAKMLASAMSRAASPTLKASLGALGIAVGKLTPNRWLRDGAYAVWRSTLPVILVSAPKKRNRLDRFSIPHQIGILVYGRGSRSDMHHPSALFARALADEMRTIA